MRILMLGWEYPPHVTGGLAVACQGLVRGLSARGVEVTFVAPQAAAARRDDGGARVLGRSGAVSAYARPAEVRRPSHLDLGGAYEGDLFEAVERYRERALAVAAGERFDLVHAHDWTSWPAGLAVARAHGVPLVAHVHSLESDRSPRALDARIVELEGRALRAAARVVCVSAYTAAAVERRHGVPRARLAVVHNAVERGAPPPPPRTPDPRTPLVLFLGRVTDQKGPEIFLEAAARVLAVQPDVRFALCGAGDRLAGAIERAAELGIARRVRFTGFLERAEVERMYQQADVFVLPSVSEPFGIAPLEAVARGVPVIVSRQSGVSEVLSGALKVDSWDVEGLADRILAVLRRPALRQSLAARAARDLEQLTWEGRGERLARVFEELLA
ncbi:MAG TPA: glycosyltransferase family 4 protein [Planctomycetota bacterium]|nr:glycosyltransferase family 4 protein [Planctomycetota bacterium]